MSKLKFLLPGGKSVTLKNPFTNLYKSINFVALFVFQAFIVLLPLSTTLLSINAETSVLKYIFAGLIALIGIYLIKTILQGAQFFIEPKGLFFILIFNLILTAFGLFVSTIRVSTTFGTDGFRYLSGIALMSLIALFYIINIYVFNKKSFNQFINLLTFGIVLYLVFYLVFKNQTYTDLLLNFPIVLLGFVLLIYRAIKSNYQILDSIIPFIYLLASILVYSQSQSGFLGFIYYFVAIYIPLFIVLGIYLKKKRSFIKSRIFNLKLKIQRVLKNPKSLRLTPSFFRELFFIGLLLSPIILIVLSLILVLSLTESSRSGIFVNTINSYIDSFKFMIGGNSSLNIDNLRAFLLGKGSDNYNLSKSYFENVLIVNGFLGLIMYLFLSGFFIKLALKRFTESIKQSKQIFMPSILFFVSIFLPIVLVFSYGNLLTIVLLWIVYSLIATSYSTLKFNYLTELVTIKNQNRKYQILRTILVLLTAIVCIYVISLVFGVLK